MGWSDEKRGSIEEKRTYYECCGEVAEPVHSQNTEELEGEGSSALVSEGMLLSLFKYTLLLLSIIKVLFYYYLRPLTAKPMVALSTLIAKVGIHQKLQKFVEN